VNGDQKAEAENVGKLGLDYTPDGTLVDIKGEFTKKGA